MASQSVVSGKNHFSLIQLVIKLLSLVEDIPQWHLSSTALPRHRELLDLSMCALPPCRALQQCLATAVQRCPPVKRLLRKDRVSSRGAAACEVHCRTRISFKS